MSDRKFEIIEQLMEELKGMMAPNAEDLGSRLGREKPPEAEIAIEIDSEEPMDLGEPEEMEMDLAEESPEEKLKNRLLKMRG